MAEEKSARCYYLDVAKVITTFLVIYGHLFSSDSTVRLYLYAFHMPLFFIISGVFHRYYGKIDWGRYIKRILWPIAIFIFLSIATNSLFYGKPFFGQIRDFIVLTATGRYKGILWFLFALFWCHVFGDCILGLKNKVVPVIIWAVLLFLPVVLDKRLPFELSNGLMAFPFYMAGFYGRDFLLKRKESVKWLIPSAVCLVLTVLITKIHGRVSMVSIKFGSLSYTLYGEDASALPVYLKLFLKGANVLLFYLNGMIGSAMIFSFSLLPFPKTGFITSLSKSLISVVGTQYLFINLIVYFWGLDNGYLISVLMSVIVFLLCYALHHVLLPAYKVFDRRVPLKEAQD
ncbi:MAG: acyltransferase family protein [Bacteroidales bacterium]|nr:acyltransferase family protein [Bacteroidales bacterium]